MYMDMKLCVYPKNYELLRKISKEMLLITFPPMFEFLILKKLHIYVDHYPRTQNHPQLQIFITRSLFLCIYITFL